MVKLGMVSFFFYQNYIHGGSVHGSAHFRTLQKKALQRQSWMPRRLESRRNVVDQGCGTTTPMTPQISFFFLWFEEDEPICIQIGIHPFRRVPKLWSHGGGMLCTISSARFLRYTACSLQNLPCGRKALCRMGDSGSK